MPKAQVRKAGPEDVGEILEIERLSFPTCWMQDFLRKEFHRPITRLWLAYLPGAPGVAGYLSALRVLDELHLLQIATHPDYRRKGVASALLEHAQRNEDGLKSILLEVRESNEEAKSFYRKMGFTLAGRRKRYYSDTGEDALLFNKEL